MNRHYQQNFHHQSSHSLKTHQLPYAIRRDICDLLDSDLSWKILGGQFIGLDSTQLALISQAYMRNSSPTEELLNKLDSANTSISDFCYYLEQMKHSRACEILKPYLEVRQTLLRSCIDKDSGLTTCMLDKVTTLETPTPSFVEQPAAILDCDEQHLFDPRQWIQDPTRLNKHPHIPDNENVQHENPPLKCHKTQPNQYQNDQPAKKHQKNEPNPDPGEEIVRMACANNRKRTSISDQEVVNQLRLIMQINYNELKQASDDFSDANIIGNGGFASVYQGNWKGTDVAIKRLKCNLMDQALNELTILNSYRIDNILPIYGISIDGPEACLVYQFMANGSLEDRLSCKKGTPPLSWHQRSLIGEGVAKGLYYLHTLRDKPLVHGDVKSANVLLDSQFVPKLGDFGLARQVFRGKNPQTELCTHCTVSSIHGTSVYLPPEYLRHKILSPAVDVYSYGIVLLEMATGRRAYDGKQLLIDLVEDETRSMSMGQISYSLKDARLTNDTQDGLKIWYELLIKLGLNCSDKIKKKRLDMGQVLSKFADFRTSSDSSLATSQNKISSISSTQPILKQEILPTEDILQNIQQTPLINYQQNIIDESYQQTRQNNQYQHNSALMSVEEEPGWVYAKEAADKPVDPLGKLDESSAQPEAVVEAMIPLLTELGIMATPNQ